MSERMIGYVRRSIISGLFAFEEMIIFPSFSVTDTHFINVSIFESVAFSRNASMVAITSLDCTDVQSDHSLLVFKIHSIF